MESYGLAHAFSFGRQHAVNTDTKAIVKDNTTHEQATQVIHRWDKLNDHVGSKCILSTIAASAILFGCASTASPQPCHASTTSTINIQPSSLIANKDEEEKYQHILFPPRTKFRIDSIKTGIQMGYHDEITRVKVSEIVDESKQK